MPNLNQVVPVTSCWSAHLPDTYARIGISRGPPRGQRGYRMYLPLAPGPWFKSAGHDAFRDLYWRQLEGLEPHQVLADLDRLAATKVPALLCFEGSHDARWCHRGLVSAWFQDRCGIDIVEYGLEDRGAGWRHPKLPDHT